MDSQLVISKRVIFAGLFGAVVISGAMYYSITHPEESRPTRDQLGSESNGTVIINSTRGGSLSKNNINELTQTDVLARNIIGPYIQTLENETYTTEDANKIIADATREMFILDYTPLDPKTILTTEDVSKEASLDYKQSLYEITKPLFTLEKYELTLYAEAVDENSKEKFDELSRIADTYNAIADDILAITAPNDISAVHLSLVNSFYKFSAVLRALSKGYDDPAASLSGTGNFTAVEEDIQQAFTNLKT
jgi:hypothetical protein